ncbi:hypothetical protein [Streptomyces sp. 1222.5]|uniref:hypothetical protein n=1 Tax=Streptomyces sp. 1222.5 TaxID=1881026 RepID=UPI003EB84E39
MSTVFNLICVALIFLVVLGLWSLCTTTIRQEDARQALLDEIALGYGPHPSDGKQGENPVTTAALERIASMPELEPGFDRLLKDVRDEQQKGDPQ